MKFIKTQYALSLNHINKRLVTPSVISALIFIFTALFLFPVLLMHDISKTEIFRQLTESMAGGIIDSEGNISALMLLLHNLRAGILSVIMGFIPFIFLPAVTSALNSVVLTAAITAVLHTTGNGILKTLAAGILPHGIFELTALFLCWGMGISICLGVTKLIFGKSSGKEFLWTLKRTAGVFCCIVFPLLAVAAIIEAYVTPVILSAVI